MKYTASLRKSLEKQELHAIPLIDFISVSGADIVSEDTRLASITSLLDDGDDIFQSTMFIELPSSTTLEPAEPHRPCKSLSFKAVEDLLTMDLGEISGADYDCGNLFIDMVVHLLADDCNGCRSCFLHPHVSA